MTASPPRLRLAVLGAGMASAPHLRSLADLSGEVEVAWLWGRDLERLRQAAVPAGTRLTTQLADVLGDPGVQAVLILTPPSLHRDLAVQAAAAGKHVLVEKPLEVDLPRAVELVEACEKAGVALAVMLQHRLRPGAAALADLLQRGALGEVLNAGAFVRWWRPQSYYDVPGRGTMARDGGGVLMTQAIHTLDLLLSLIGVPERVTGAARTTSVHRMECEDTAAALLHYPGGMTAVLQATTAAFPGYAERIEIDGTLGSATLESGVLTARLANGDTVSVGASVGSGGGADPMAFDHGPHRSVIEDFVHAIRSGAAPGVSGRSALAVQRVIDAVLASARSGVPVKL